MAAARGRARAVRMIRIAVTGAKGQVATSLVERAGPEFEIVTLSRPAFSLEDRDAVLAGIEAARPDVVINTAAYTAVDKAESEEDLAMRVNGDGAGYVAEAAASAGAPLLHLSTDYVFDGALDRPYREQDPQARPAPMAVRNSSAKCGWPNIAPTARSCAPPGCTAHSAPILSARCCGSARRAMKSASSPTARQSDFRARHRRCASGDRQKAPRRQLPGASRPLPYDRRGRGDLGGLRRGGVRGSPGEGTTPYPGQAHYDVDYPTPARRPANSRLDNEKLRRAYGFLLPDWRISLAACCARLIS